jgi:DNA (cytosine-5)-methyltransferase 1
MYKSISLFSGAFGLDIGLEQAGIETTLAIDFEKDCVETMKLNCVNAIQGDISSFVNKDPSCKSILRKANIRQKDLFLISGGPPCQSFSTAGNRGFDQDSRGALIYDFAHIVSKLQPRFFIMENVRGLLSSDTLDSKCKKVKVVDVLMKKFKEAGYKVICSLIDSVNYGVPQHRDRVIFIGSRDNEDIFIPEPSHFKLHQNPELRWKTLGDVISNLKEKDQVYSKFSPQRKSVMSRIPEGGNWRDLPKNIAQKAMGAAYEAQGGRTSYYRRLNSGMPCPTLTTSPGQRATTLCHPTKDRPLSIREYARVQQFPDDWEFKGTTASIYRQLGNAVPVGVGKAIGEMFVSVAEKKHEVSSKKRPYKEFLISA